MALFLLAGGDTLAGHGYLRNSNYLHMDDISDAVDTIVGLIIILWIPCGFYAGVIAASKDHNWLPWIFGGLLFGPVALIATAGLPDRKLTRYIRLLSEDKKETTEESGSITRQQSLKPSDLR